MSEELSETDYKICMMAVIKCHLLNTYVKSGIQMNPLTEKNFGFAEMTDEEESVLVKKLHKAAELTWLKSQRGTGEQSMSDCKYGVPYAEHVQGTPFERYRTLNPDYNPIICCHRNAPYIIFKGEKDNYQCEKAKASGQCPIGNSQELMAR